MLSFIEQLPMIGPILAAAIPFLFVLGVVVAIHEYGHYIVARWCGVHSDVFSIGFGPEIVGWDDKRGTRWKLCPIPLGGYVKFRGDADAASAQSDDEALETLTEEERAAAFPNATLPRRAAIVSAGPIFNFILTTVLIAGIAMTTGVPNGKPVIGSVTEGQEGARAGFEVGDRIVTVGGETVEAFGDFAAIVINGAGTEYDIEVERDGTIINLPMTYAPPIMVDRLKTGSAADDAGLEPGDEIVEINGEKIQVFDEMRAAVIDGDGAPLSVGVMRDGEAFTFELTPRRTETRNAEGEIVVEWLVGIYGAPGLGLGSEIETAGPVEALKTGATYTYNVIAGTLFFIYEMFGGRGDTADLGGPIRIAEVSGQAAQQGWGSLIELTALLSASIGLINLFPIPVLDGGHLLFYGIEAIRGKPLNEKAQEIGLTIGLALVMMLMIYATYNDVMRL